MKKIVFFGAPDKSHLLLVLGKLLTALERKVLIVDSTLAQSMQGYLPQCGIRLSLREFEGMDVATGLHHIRATGASLLEGRRRSGIRCHAARHRSHRICERTRVAGL